ncbi:unnamed protein product, partial [Amoebophrya sp. A25]|eukprot:GSA25T00003826001.1
MKQRKNRKKRRRKSRKLMRRQRVGKISRKVAGFLLFLNLFRGVWLSNVQGWRASLVGLFLFLPFDSGEPIGEGEEYDQPERSRNIGGRPTKYSKHGYRRRWYYLLKTVKDVRQELKYEKEYQNEYTRMALALSE